MKKHHGVGWWIAYPHKAEQSCVLVKKKRKSLRPQLQAPTPLKGAALRICVTERQKASEVEDYLGWEGGVSVGL